VLPGLKSGRALVKKKNKKNHQLLKKNTPETLSLLFNGDLGSLPDIKRPELEVNYSPSASAKVKNEWKCTCTACLS
jgi:hypothetical protein